MAEYSIFAKTRISSASLAHSLLLTHSLTDHSCKARHQTKQCMATILRHKNKLTGGIIGGVLSMVGCAFWDSDGYDPFAPLHSFHIPLG